MKKKRSLNSIIDSLVDDDGLKTEVTITITDQTLFKVITALLSTGIGVILIHHLLKNQFPNQQLHQLTSEVSSIKNQISA